MRNVDPTFISPTGESRATAAPTLQPGLACCLSGGGYRAMLFHAGSLWRLNEAGLLPRLTCVSSVSGGSIIAAVLAARWKDLQWREGVATNFVKDVAEPVRELARHTIDVRSVLVGILNPFGTVADRIVAAYRKYLFGNKTLQDLPELPVFVLNAANVQTAALWQFTRDAMGDYLVGFAEKPTLELAVAVGASSAFPPFLSPVHLDLGGFTFKPLAISQLHQPPYTTKVVLSDGGVYDNLGLEPVFKKYQTILVSDGGQKIVAEPDPASDWARHSYRVLDLVDNQVRSLRKRILINAYLDKSHTGAYWGIRTNIADYDLPDALNAACPHEETLKLAAIPTRLAAMQENLQERLINWGYAVCDAALRKHYDPTLKLPYGFPYAEVKV